MFLSNDPHCLPVLERTGLFLKRRSRKILYWFQDIQYTLDHPGLENAQLWLICAEDIIYKPKLGFDRKEDERDRAEDAVKQAWESQLAERKGKPLTEDEDRALRKEIDDLRECTLQFAWNGHLMEIDRQYRYCLQSLQQLTDKSDTLTVAKAQMKAFEKQQKRNASPVVLHYKIADIPRTIFDHLYDLKQENAGLCSGRQSKEKFISDCEALWEKCKVQPISLLLLPVVLTIFLIEGRVREDVSSYLKSKKRYQSVENLKGIARVYEAVCNLLELGYKDCLKWRMPIFYWEKIEEKFYEHVGLSAEDWEQAHIYLSELRYKNGLSKVKERELAELSYGPELKALAKICNLNSFLMITLQTPRDENPPDITAKNVVMPAKVKAAYKRLREGKILPRSEGSRETFDSYFAGLYTILGMSDFSCIALLRYYHLPIDQLYTYMPNGLMALSGMFERTTSGFAERIVHEFKQEQEVFPHYFDLKSKDEAEQTGKDTSYGLCITPGYGKSKFKIEYIQKGRRLSAQIADKFTEDDYRKFISNIQHFECGPFRKYLTQFCKEKRIGDFYSGESDWENVLLENDAFSTIMDLVQNYLARNFYEYWEQHISTEFHLYDDAEN